MESAVTRHLDCTVGNRDVKYHISAEDKSFCPDVSVVCGKSTQVVLQSINVTVSMAELYHRTDQF